MVEDWPPHLLHTSGIGKGYPEIHDPDYAEIEQVMKQVGIKFYQVTPYALDVVQTARCISKNHIMMINIINGKLTISIEPQNPWRLPLSLGVGKLFDLHKPGSLFELLQHLRRYRTISLVKYWLTYIKLWWNK